MTLLCSRSARRLTLASAGFILFAATAVPKGTAAEGNEAPVNPEELTALIKKVDQIVVYDSPLYFDDRPPKELYRSKAKKDITAFAEVAQVTKGDWFMCRCTGTLAVSLFRGDEQLVSVGRCGPIF